MCHTRWTLTTAPTVWRTCLLPRPGTNIRLVPSLSDLLRLKKNRCANCFDCPHCSHSLSTRATSTAAPSPEDPAKVIAKKVYYLACAFCRWTSRDIGLPDQTVASGGWPELENPHGARILNLQEHYRAIAQREKVEKESRKFFGRKLSYLQVLLPLVPSPPPPPSCQTSTA